jgi:hypothetical protein
MRNLSNRNMALTMAVLLSSATNCAFAGAVPSTVTAPAPVSTQGQSNVRTPAERNAAAKALKAQVDSLNQAATIADTNANAAATATANATTGAKP